MKDESFLSRTWGEFSQNRIAVVALTVASATGSNSLLEPASSTATVTVVVWFPSASASFTPVTVTVCGLFQFAVVNVSVAGPTVASLVSPLARKTGN